MIKINPISFCGKLIRTTETRSRINKETGERERYKHTYSKDEFRKSYDKKIKEIQREKEFAMKVDDLMHNDEDIKKAIKDLPDTTTVELLADYSNCDYDKSSVVIEAQDTNKKYIEHECFCIDYSKNPDKKEILNYLKELKEELKPRQKHPFDGKGYRPLVPGKTPVRCVKRATPKWDK